MRIHRAALATTLLVTLGAVVSHGQASSKEVTYDISSHTLSVPNVNGYIQVDGAQYTSLGMAVIPIPSGGRGKIFDPFGENDTLGNPIAVNPFPNDKAVDLLFGAGVVINTKVPLVLGNGSTVTGSGRVITGPFGLNSGTLIAPGTGFPVPMNQPSAPTLTCHSNLGHLSNGTYRMTLTQVNNINTYAPGGIRAVTPGETIGTANEASVTCSNGTSVQSITFTTPAQQIPGGNATFESQGTKIYITAGASGTEIFDDASNTSNVTCTQSTTFPTACADSTSVTILTLPSTGNPAPKLNTTNPLVVLGDVGPYSGTNEFGIRVSNLVVDGIVDAGTSAPGVAGIVCIANFNSQEQGAIQYVNMLNCMGTTTSPGTGFLGFGPTTQNFSMHDFEVNVTASGATNLTGYTPVYLVGVQPGFKSISDFTINNTTLGTLPSSGYPTAGITLDGSSGHVYNGHCEHVSSCLALVNNSKVVADYISGGSGPTSPTVTNVVHLDNTTINADLQGLISGCNPSGANCSTVLDDTTSSTIQESGAFSPTGWYYLGSPQPNNSSVRDRFSSNSAVPSFYAGSSQHLSSQASDVPLVIGPGQTVTQTGDFLDIFVNSSLSTKLFSVGASGLVTVKGTAGASGALSVSGGTSGALTITTQTTAGTPTWTAGTSSGTPAVTASLPLVITAGTGNISLPFEGTSTAKVQMTTSVTPTTNDVVTYDSLGNVQDSGLPAANVGAVFTAWCTGAVGTANATAYQLAPGTNNGLSCTIAGSTATIPIPITCTAKNLYVTASAAGGVAGSGVVTLTKAGTGSTALTSTLGTSTSCNDTTHSVSFSAGNNWGVIVTTGQASDSTANVKASFQCQ